MKIEGNTVKSLIDFAIKSGVSRIDAYYLLSYLIERTKEDILANIDDKVSPLQVLKWKHIIKKRLKGVPANYITGSKEFYSLNFKVDRSVLIPRPETELIVDEILKSRPSSLLDLGTGSGNIAISVKYHLPNCNVTAIDISRHALKIAEYNCKAILGDLTINFIRSDFCSGVNGTYDVIVSNPPYIPDSSLKRLQKEVSVFEPKIALSGGEDGLRAYRKIFSACGNCMKKKGRLILEVSDEVLEGVKNLADDYGWLVLNIINDYSGIPRVMVLKLK